MPAALSQPCRFACCKDCRVRRGEGGGDSSVITGKLMPALRIAAKLDFGL